MCRGRYLCEAGTGIEDLLDVILLVAEIEDLQGNPMHLHGVCR